MSPRLGVAQLEFGGTSTPATLTNWAGATLAVRLHN
jgi:hypothetical protein